MNANTLWDDFNFSYILLEKREKVAVLTLNNPNKLNAMDDRLLAELREAYQNVMDASDIKALVITSTAKKAFCAGIHVSYVRGLSNEQAGNFFFELAEFFEWLIHCPFPTIAAVDGYAFGAGADLALACDIRIGATRASFRFPGPQFGVVLGTQRLMDEIGPAQARFLALTNQLIDANRALQLGIIQEKVAEESLTEYACQVADAITRVPEHTTGTIKSLTNGQKAGSPPDLTRDSIVTGDFQERFAGYLERLKKK
ncbi:enoyl-CoA hydratase/isomerase family protein [Bacillus piscicola]|uniref:enoyl-CoA hydratase/isomerase family protein n=1 Tax=Bacillus piscicola TaxID=1632684 RepID=UPI001F08E208